MNESGEATPTSGPVAWATFHHVPVKEGEAIYLQEGESVLSVEYDSESGFMHAVVMAWHSGSPDGGTPA